MKNIKETVLKCHTELLRDNDINEVSSVEMEMTPDNGIDSVGIVTLILEIEEQLDLELDAYLADIRNCKTIGDLIEVIENACKK